MSSPTAKAPTKPIAPSRRSAVTAPMDSVRLPIQRAAHSTRYRSAPIWLHGSRPMTWLRAQTITQGTSPVLGLITTCQRTPTPMRAASAHARYIKNHCGRAFPINDATPICRRTISGAAAELIGPLGFCRTHGKSFSPLETNDVEPSANTMRSRQGTFHPMKPSASAVAAIWKKRGHRRVALSCSVIGLEHVIERFDRMGERSGV